MEFQNRQLMDWTNLINIAGIEAAIRAFPLGGSYSHMLGGETIAYSKNGRFISVDPNSPQNAAGAFLLHDSETMPISRLMQNIHEAHFRFSTEYPWVKRVEIARNVARLINERYFHYCASLVIEVGKSWAEADGEVAEAEDFARWDALIAEEDFSIRPPATLYSVSAYNGVMAVPHGTFIILIPYNFPFAIGLDMTLKALLAGNAVVICPSDKAARTGWLLYSLLCDAFRVAGIDPTGIVNFAPTTPLDGHAMAHALLASPYASGLCFTGSSAVLDALKAKYCAPDFKRWNGGTLRIGAAETSGVNALYIDKSANTEAAAHDIMKSFLGISGQKCSSVRRVIAHEDIEKELFARVCAEIDKVQYGDTKKGAYLGAMISPEAVKKLESDIDAFEKEGIARVAYVKDIARRSDYDFAPRILWVNADTIKDAAKLRRLGNTEFFGPVTTFITVPDFATAEHVFNASEFALTGGIWSNDPAQIRRAILHWRAGNFYVNRKITGAYVGSEQFGGLVSRSAESGIPTGPHALAFFYSVKSISGNYPTGDTVADFGFARDLDDYVTFGKF